VRADGDDDNLAIRYRDLRVQVAGIQMLLVLLRAMVSTLQGDDQRILTLELDQLSQLAV
jgi:hypothetical protein